MCCFECSCSHAFRKEYEAARMTKDAWTVFQVPKGSDVSALHENVKKTWRFIFNDCFDNSGYVFDHTKFDLECYLEEETYIYVSITNADLKE